MPQPQPQNLHRQIMLDEQELDQRVIDSSADEAVEQFIAKFLRDPKNCAKFTRRLESRGDRLC